MNYPNAKITIEHDCPHCGALGVVPNPVWCEFWKQPNAKEINDDAEKLEEWFESRGLMQDSRPHMGKTVRLFPEEEFQCPDCEGYKRISKAVTLDELKVLLGIERIEAMARRAANNASCPANGIQPD